VTRLCQLFGVTRAGYYAWRVRPASAHARQDWVLLEEMRAIFEASHGTYGSPRLHEALTARGYHVSRRRVERLMRVGGWRARAVQVYRRTAARIGGSATSESRGSATGPSTESNLVGDLTYLRAAGRWWNLVVVLDQYSRRVLAWRLAGTHDARLTRAVLDAAIRRRQPGRGLIFHSDRGSEFLGMPFRSRSAAGGLRAAPQHCRRPDGHVNITTTSVHPCDQRLPYRAGADVSEQHEQARIARVAARGIPENAPHWCHADAQALLGMPTTPTLKSLIRLRMCG
jgi:putative transposase